jgi:hypothetical protein
MTHFVRALALLTFVALDAPAQEDLRLQGGTPGGLRTTLTDSWGVLQFTVANPTAADKNARVSVLYPDKQAVRYARDVWVPARSAISFSLPVGPPPTEGSPLGRQIEMVLSDRTGGGDRTVFLPGMEKVQTRPVIYKARAPTTAILIDYPTDEMAAEHPTRPTSRAAQVVNLVRLARSAAGLSEEVALLPPDSLPPTAEAFDSTDHLVIAGNRLAADPAGRLAVRHWLQQGGRLWVMLDLVEPDTVLALLGDELPFQVVDRVGLTTLKVHRPPGSPPATGRDFDKPVEQIRVIPGPADQVTHVANGWPAAFVRPVGRGRALFTTLSVPGWLRPQTPVGGKGIGAKRPAEAPPPGQPQRLVATTPLEEIAGELRPPAKPHPFTAEDLRPLLTEEIGYTVPSRGMAAGVLGAFLVALLALGLGLRRSRRPELVGWLAPVAALIAGGVFVGIGVSSRRAIPPTTAVAAVADAVPGSGETAVNGLFALYQPESGTVPLATHNGGLLDLDPEGLEGQARRRVQTDVGRWHMEDLSLPAGVRTGPFHYTARTGPVSAVARFGPNGVEGKLTAASFRDPADSLITTPAREPLALRFSEGTFAATPADQLAPDQFLAGAVLTDRQQRRQAVYRKLLTGPLPRHLEGRDFLMAWVEPHELPFVGQDGARTIGTVLLVVPLDYEPSPTGTRVTVPAAFIPYRRLADGTLRTPTMESPYPAEMELRFQLPDAVRPLTVERATLHLRIRAPSRRVVVAGLADGRQVPLFTEDSPAEPIRVEIADPALLRQDDQGGLHLNVAITNVGGGQLDNPWKIESLGLQVTGTVGR